MELSSEEIDREVYMTIRAFQDNMSKKAIIAEIRRRLPELTDKEIGESLLRLAKD